MGAGMHCVVYFTTAEVCYMIYHMGSRGVLYDMLYGGRGVRYDILYGVRGGSIRYNNYGGRCVLYAIMRGPGCTM